MVDLGWFSWTVDFHKREFIHLKYTEDLHPLFDTKKDFPVWWNHLIQTDRITLEVGQTFTVIGSDALFSDSNFITKGIVLDTDPLVISGTTKRHDLVPDDITFSQLTQAIENYNSQSNGNITHLLKAPINRIRGLTGILIQELNLKTNDAMLLEYLKDSANRLSTVFNHVLSGEQFSLTFSSTTVGEVLNEVNDVLCQVFDLKGFKLFEQPEPTEISAESGKMLHEVTMRIMLNNAFPKDTPRARWTKVDESTGYVSFLFENDSPEEDIDFMGVTGIAPPPASVKLLPGSLVIHEVRGNNSEYKIVLTLN
ncbi:MAG: hypothetical protein GC193_05505 [Cryomorphaceae bacterium]|nr:hypothetical protein [Cryomorphaceae bacterium]